MMKKQYIYLIVFHFALICFMLTPGCKKRNEWLEIKNNKSKVVPETAADFQALLDNSNVMNSQYTTDGLVGVDNYYLSDVAFAASPEVSRNLYLWNKEIWPTESATSWNNLFRIIAYANLVLDGIKNMTNTSDYANIKGQALFFRAFAYYHLSQIYCKAYSSSASTDPGIPIRLNSDVNEIVSRGLLDDTYHQITEDASQAAELLTANQLYLQRPTNAASLALLAKTYLNMGDYEAAERYASKCLAIKPQLLDFNNSALVNLSSTYRFPVFSKNNPEVLFYAEANSGFAEVLASSSTRGLVSPELYQSYDADDLRKKYFFAASGPDFKFRGTYTGRQNNFYGLATNEVYLILAECSARLGNTQKAIKDLNHLLVNRYPTGKFTPLAAVDADAALGLVLSERRKELPFVGNQRWEDLKRLNKEPVYQKTISRVINGVVYSLLPNDNRYVLPIPVNELKLSLITQNER